MLSHMQFNHIEVAYPIYKPKQKSLAIHGMIHGKIWSVAPLRPFSWPKPPKALAAKIGGFIRFFWTLNKSCVYMH